MKKIYSFILKWIKFSAINHHIAMGGKKPIDYDDIIGEKPKTQSDYQREHKKLNPKQFDGAESQAPFVKTRKKKQKSTPHI
jgi:hypothetical protein